MPQIKVQLKSNAPAYSRRRPVGKHAVVSRGSSRLSVTLPLRRHFPIRRVLTILTVLSCSLLLLIWLQIQIDNASVRIKELEQRINDQLSTNRYTRSEIDIETTYDLLYPIVKSRFGMVFPVSSPEIIMPVPEEVLSHEK